MWSTLLLPLLLLHFVQLHATVAMATASGGLTVIEGASTTSSSPSSSSSNTNSNNPSTSTSSTTTTTTTTTSSSSSSRTSNSNAVASSNQRKRHRKRNSSWYDYRNYSENNTAIEWMNPCGGSYYTPSATERRRAQRPKQIFNQLKRAAGTEYRELNSTQEQKGIDIDDMQLWSLHKYNYKFLPKLKPNSTIALKRWYRNMQTYVASFAYLRRVQINWDRQFLKRESAVAKELKKLLLSSRSMLCELETAVNRTYPAPLAVAPGKQRRQLQLPQISRNDMNRRLKLRSKRRHGAAAAAAATTTEAASSVAGAGTAIGEADSMDMRFVKHHYYEFLRTMWQLLRRDSKRERQQRRQRRQRRQQRQRQLQQQQQHLPLHRQQHQLQLQQQQRQRQQRQWQQRLQETLFGAGNRKEFNEVSKPQLDVARGSLGRRGKRQQPHAAAATGSANQRRQQQRRVLRT